MSMEVVKEELINIAESEAKEIVAEAKKEKKEILSNAKSRIKEMERESEEQFKQRKESLKSDMEAEAQSEIKSKKLSVRKELIDAVFDQALENLSNLSKKKREKLLKNIVDAVEKEFDVSTVYCSSKDKGSKAINNYNVVLSDMAGGLILEDKDGNKRVDLSYETLLEEVKQEKLAEITKVLFA